MSALSNVVSGPDCSASHPVLRRLTAADLDQLEALEQASYDFPWTRGIFSDCIRVGYGCYGLHVGSSLVAYAIHNWGAGESHLLNLCVHPDWRRRKLAAILLEHVVTQARLLACDRLILEVRPSNPAAMALYEQRGFKTIGRRPNYYRSSDGREDAIVMQLELPAAPKNR